MEVHIGAQVEFARQGCQHRSLGVWILGHAHIQQLVKAARPQQRSIQQIRPVQGLQVRHGIAKLPEATAGLLLGLHVRRMV